MRNRLMIFVVLAVVIVSTTILVIKLQPTNTTANNATTEDNRVKGVSTQQEQEPLSDPLILKTISIEEAKILIADNKGNQDFVILDIRTSEEFDQGHIEGAVNMDFYDEFDQKIAGLDKNKTYLVYCRSGNRSSQAMSSFKAQGFAEIYEISGGYNKFIL